MNVIARLEYEPAYYDFAVHHFNHYTMRTPPLLSEYILYDIYNIMHMFHIIQICNIIIYIILYSLVWFNSISTPYKSSNVEIWFICKSFANGLGDRGSISGRVIPKTLKMVLDASLLNTQHYKVCIKDKVEQSRERSSALPYTSV